MPNNIEPIVRGNTVYFDILPIDEQTKEPYILQEGDKTVFTLRDYRSFKLFEATLTSADYPENGDALKLTIPKEITAKLAPDTYFCDVMLVFADGTTDTFITKSELVVESAVGTYKEL